MRYRSVTLSIDALPARMRPSLFMKRHLLVTFAIILLSVVCWGWVREGHQIIATVAEDHPDESTKVMIQSVIGNNHPYSIASWADDVRKESRDTAPWHYLDIRLGSAYDASRDCSLPHSCGRCRGIAHEFRFHPALARQHA
jgi:hypothetical protein